MEWHKKVKTGKQSHLAVTDSGDTTYKELFGLFSEVGTKFCSKIVVVTIVPNGSSDTPESPELATHRGGNSPGQSED